MKENYPYDKVLITVERKNFTAAMSPDANGDVYFNETVIGRVPDNNAPLPFDMYYERLPQEGEVQEAVESVAESMKEQFYEQVFNVYEKVSKADDPLQTILDMDRDEFVGPSPEEAVEMNSSAEDIFST